MDIEKIDEDVRNNVCESLGITRESFDEVHGDSSVYEWIHEFICYGLSSYVKKNFAYSADYYKRQHG